MVDMNLVYLLPVTDEDWSLLEDADVGDMGKHTRCKECKQSDFIAYYISHKPGCSTAAKLRQSIASLSEEERKALYAGTEHF